MQCTAANLFGIKIYLLSLISYKLPLKIYIMKGCSLPRPPLNGPRHPKAEVTKNFAPNLRPVPFSAKTM